MTTIGHTVARLRLTAGLPNDWRNVQTTVSREECAALVNHIAARDAEIARLREDAERWRVARSLAFGIADWGNPHAKPVIATLDRADAVVDAKRALDGGAV